jgi:hypothetical protein
MEPHVLLKLRVEFETMKRHDVVKLIDAYTKLVDDQLASIALIERLHVDLAASKVYAAKLATGENA